MQLGKRRFCPREQKCYEKQVSSHEAPQLELLSTISNLSYQQIKGEKQHYNYSRV